MKSEQLHFLEPKLDELFQEFVAMPNPNNKEVLEVTGEVPKIRSLE